MKSLQTEADTAQAEVEKLTAKIQELEQDNQSKDEEIATLSTRHQMLEEQVEETEKLVREVKRLYVSLNPLDIQKFSPLTRLDPTRMIFRPVIMSVVPRHFRPIATSGRPSIMTWQQNMPSFRRTSIACLARWEKYKHRPFCTIK